MKSSKHNRQDQSTVRQREPASTVDSDQSESLIHFWKVVYLVLGFSVMIIAIIVIRRSSITPKPDMVDATAIADQSPRQAGVLGDPSERTAIPTGSTVVLPDRPEDINVEQVEKELVELAEQLSKLYPDDPGALHTAAYTYSELLQTARAEELWKRCVAMAPQLPDPYVGLAKVLMQGGKVQEAVEILQRATANQQTSAELIHTSAEASEKLGDLAAAEKTLIDGMTQFPAAAKNWLRLAQVQIQLGRFPEAEASSRKAMELGDNSVPSLVALSTALARQGKAQEAGEIRKQLSQQLSKTKDQSKTRGDTFQTDYARSIRRLATHAFANGGATQQRHGDLSAAEKLFLRALSLEPDQLPCYIALGSMYRQAGRLGDAIAVHRRMIELQPDNVLNYTNLASLAVQVGDEALSEKTLKQAAERNPDSGLPQWLLARFYLATGRNSEAFTFASEAADRLKSVDAYLVLISASRAIGNPEAASRALEKALQVGPNDPRLANVRQANDG